MTTPNPMEAVALLRSAIQKQLDPTWECNSDHPVLHEALRLTASIEAPASDPVAQICGTWELRWIGSGPIAPIIHKHGLKIGDYLYAGAAPPAQPAFNQAEFDTLVEKGTKAWAGVELVDGHVPAGVPVDERVAAREHMAIAGKNSAVMIGWTLAEAFQEGWAARAALQQPGQTVPDGWKLVPLEPTEAMVHAGEGVPIPRFFGKVYRAMVAAAPTDPREAE
jgi:hypothetical protein